MRVIAGSARGRQLRSPTSLNTRPTTDLVKGALFSMLEAEAYRRAFEPDDEHFASGVAWPRVLELYAGSGALGIEALSRGAQSADFVEVDGQARRDLQANIGRTGFADRAQVLPISAERALDHLAGPYDLVLLDPPYDEPSALAVLERLAASSLVTSNSAIVFEHGQKTVPPAQAGPFRLARSNRHGRTYISLYIAGRETPD